MNNEQDKGIEYLYKTEPYAHQRTSYERFHDAPYFALFYDVGCGKTKGALDIAQNHFVNGNIDSIVVIAPNNVHRQWIVDQLPKHCAVDYEAYVWGDKSKASIDECWKFIMDEDRSKLKIFAVNTECFQGKIVPAEIRLFLQKYNPFVIMDESSKIKNHMSKRARHITAVFKNTKYRCILTGTPSAHSPLDLYGQFEFLCPGIFPEYNQFRARYAVLVRDRHRHIQTITEHEWDYTHRALRGHCEGIYADNFMEVAGKLGINDWDTAVLIYQHRQPQRYQNQAELKLLIEPYSMAIKITDIEELPKKTVNSIKVKPNENQRQVYSDLISYWQASIDDGSKVMDVAGTLALLVRCRQVTGGFFPDTSTKSLHAIPGPNPKLLRMGIEAMREVLNGRRIIVWATFTAEIKVIKAQFDKLGIQSKTYFGETLAEERSSLIQEFHENKFQVLIANPSAAGYGLNLQCATRQFFYSNTFKVEERIQAEGRSWRVGVLEDVVVTDFVIGNTIDTEVLRAIKRGKDCNEYFRNYDIENLRRGWE